MLLHTTPDMIEKVSTQLEKLIEVEMVRSQEGSQVDFELSERIVDVD
jgi:hypothetical protein